MIARLTDSATSATCHALAPCSVRNWRNVTFLRFVGPTQVAQILRFDDDVRRGTRVFRYLRHHLACLVKRCETFRITFPPDSRRPWSGYALRLLVLGIAAFDDRPFAFRQIKRLLDYSLPHAWLDFTLDRRVTFEHFLLFGTSLDAYTLVDGTDRPELRGVMRLAFRHFDDGAVGEQQCRRNIVFACQFVSFGP